MGPQKKMIPKKLSQSREMNKVELFSAKMILKTRRLSTSKPKTKMKKQTSVRFVTMWINQRRSMTYCVEEWYMANKTLTFNDGWVDQ